MVFLHAPLEKKKRSHLTSTHSHYCHLSPSAARTEANTTYTTLHVLVHTGQEEYGRLLESKRRTRHHSAWKPWKHAYGWGGGGLGQAKPQPASLQNYPIPSSQNKPPPSSRTEPGTEYRRDSRREGRLAVVHKIASNQQNEPLPAASPSAVTPDNASYIHTQTFEVRHNAHFLFMQK